MERGVQAHSTDPLILTHPSLGGHCMRDDSAGGGHLLTHTHQADSDRPTTGLILQDQPTNQADSGPPIH